MIAQVDDGRSVSRRREVQQQLVVIVQLHNDLVAASNAMQEEAKSRSKKAITHFDLEIARIAFLAVFAQIGEDDRHTLCAFNRFSLQQATRSRFAF